MKIEEELDQLRQKYRDNDYRLSKHDTLEAREKLRIFLRDGDNWQQAVEYVVDFPDNIGIETYVDFYRGIGLQKRMKLNRFLVENEKFQDNDNFRSVRRMVALLNELLSFEVEEEEIYFLLQNMNRLILQEGNKKIPDDRLEKVLSVFNTTGRIRELQQELNRVKSEKQELENGIQLRDQRLEKMHSLATAFRRDYEKLKELNRELRELIEKRME